MEYTRLGGTGLKVSRLTLGCMTAPIVGPTKPHHLSDAVAALDVGLTDDEAAALEEPYGPHRRSF